MYIKEGRGHFSLGHQWVRRSGKEEKAKEKKTGEKAKGSVPFLR